MSIKVIKTGPLGVNTLIVKIEEGADKGKCFVVDPAASLISGDKNNITDYLKSQNLECIAIILTHSHFDHILGLRDLKETFPHSKIYLHDNEATELSNPPGPMNVSVLNSFGAGNLLQEVAKQPPADTLLKDGQNIFGWKVLHTPGHTPGSICLYNKNQKILISGDTLFAYGSYGRTDMYGGDSLAMHRSLERLRKEVAPDTIVYPGHDSFAFKFSD